MPFPDRAKTEDEAPPAFRGAGLIKMGDNAWIEQGRGLERIFVHEIGADQLSLYLTESGVSSKGAFHFVGAPLEDLQKVAVATFEIFEDIGQLAGRRLDTERQNPFDDMVGARLVRWVEIARLGRWLERAHDDPRGIRAQKESLPVQEGDL